MTPLNLTQDGKYLKFDRKGNDEILSEPKASDRKDHLRVDVAGDVEGDMLKVTSVALTGQERCVPQLHATPGSLQIRLGG